MAESLSRRKYSRLVRFFSSIIDDPNTSQRTKMTAAQRLDDIYRRNEERTDKAKERAERALERAAAQQGQSDIPTGAAEAPAELTAEEQAQAFLASIRTQHEGRPND